ncbi:MAG: tyrosine-type recombinase/integrase [Planctomycetaceae bacterium]
MKGSTTVSKSNLEKFVPVGDKTSIFNRGGTWHVNYQHEGRQIRRSLKTKSKKEALIQASRIDRDIVDGVVAERIKNATVDEALQAFYEFKQSEDRAKKTLKKYRSIIEEIRELAQDRRVVAASQLDPQFADAFRARLRKNENSAETINDKLVLLRSVVLYAYSRQIIDRDSLKGYKLQKPKPTPQPCWKPDQADVIVEAAPETYRPFLLFLRDTGCRVGEAKFLTWDDVDLDEKVVHIREKKGWKPKTGDQWIIPLSVRLQNLLAGLPHASEWVFTAPVTAQHPAPDRQISERRALQGLKRVLTKLDLRGHLHTFRHTFVSELLRTGHTPEPVVRSIVGHVDEETLKLYTHVSRELPKAYIGKLDRLRDEANGAGNNRLGNAAGLEDEQRGGKDGESSD